LTAQKDIPLFGTAAGKGTRNRPQSCRPWGRAARLTGGSSASAIIEAAAETMIVTARQPPGPLLTQRKW